MKSPMPLEKENQELSVNIRSNIFNKKQRRLRITPEFIEYEYKPGSGTFITFNKDEISEYRYGINWISGYQFTIGREYVIFITNSSNEVIKINFKTLYGFKKTEYQKLYNQILTTLWNHYFVHIARKFINEFNKGNIVTIGRATLSWGVVVINNGGIISEKKVIPWRGLETKKYYTYVAIYSSEEPSKLHATFSYLNDWNTWVLFNVVKTILKHKNASLN